MASDRYKVNPDGSISTLQALQVGPGVTPIGPTFRMSKQAQEKYQNEAKNYPYTSIAEAQNASLKITNKKIEDAEASYKKQIADLAQQGNIASAIAQIYGSGRGTPSAGGATQGQQAGGLVNPFAPPSTIFSSRATPESTLGLASLSSQIAGLQGKAGETQKFTKQDNPEYIALTNSINKLKENADVAKISSLTPAEINKKINESNARLAKTPAKITGQVANPALSALSNQVAVLNGQLSRLNPNSPQDRPKIQQLNLQIKELSNRIKNSPKTIPGPVDNPEYKKISTEIANYNSGLQVKTLVEQQAKVPAKIDTTTQTPEYLALQRQIQEAEQTYGQKLSSLSQAGISAPSTTVGLGESQLGGKLNYQISDQQIVDDYNNSRLKKLNDYVSSGNAQIVAIQDRLTAARDMLSKLPKDSAQYNTSKVFVDQLTSDLASVNDAVKNASDMVKNFKPIGLGSTEASKQITSLREYLQLPEERATQQLRQIDPESYQTAVALGQQYRKMATEELGPTTTAQTEQLRSQIEQEAINQIALGSQLGAEEQRQYQQAARAAQAARGNIFGVAPAVEEAVTTGAAGEQRKLARYGAAAQFLASGESTGAAAARDLALREGLTQQRLGSAANFLAGGPSLYNLGQARTAQQQQAMQAYVQANQAMPGQFGPGQSTVQPFYQTTQPNIPVDLTQTFANLYGSMADYGARTYGAYTAAQASRPTFAQQFGAIASGISGFVPKFSFTG